MSPLQAPYRYVAEHYEHTVRVDDAFPEIADFVYSSFRHVRGDAVLNLGCGTTFYDYFPYFGTVPARYVGIDINQSSLDYLKHSDHPRLLKARTITERRGSAIELICADVLTCTDRLESQFDCILGVGFFGTFSGGRRDRLMKTAHRWLKPAGRLVKVTWHGPHRTPEQTRDKHKYGFDNEEEVAPEELVAAIEKGGFVVRENATLLCDPQTYRWDKIQICTFEKV